MKILGVSFSNEMLLTKALTHRSYVNEVEGDVPDNERLEFLGDAVLGFITAEMLFHLYPNEPEGWLTLLRSALVRTESLAILADNCNLGDYLLMGRGEVNSGGRSRVTNLCRGFEAVIGALFIDQGVDAVKAFVLPRLNDLLAYILKNKLHLDARSMLQERSQAELRFTPVYRVVDTEGPEHEKEFIVEVLVGGVVLGRGSGASKRGAAQSAARTALQLVEDNGWPAEVEMASIQVAEGATLEVNILSEESETLAEASPSHDDAENLPAE
ncbi:ribonuclease III [Phototrophicus methaneseepsis]|uniref:Ribonuclease 3 n=2 Tax=Phototrophicus methaneseepsis TaxID=2710758 RepID=A0A7S8EDZ9_9CHLR|nr:ribonuclease III [Phototrophicus methaneseepsis]